MGIHIRINKIKEKLSNSKGLDYGEMVFLINVINRLDAENAQLSYELGVQSDVIRALQVPTHPIKEAVNF